MSTTKTPTVMKTPARPADPDRPVKVKNAACPRCHGPVYFSRSAWLHCRTYPTRYDVNPAE